MPERKLRHPGQGAASKPVEPIFHQSSTCSSVRRSAQLKPQAVWKTRADGEAACLSHSSSPHKIRFAFHGIFEILSVHYNFQIFRLWSGPERICAIGHAENQSTKILFFHRLRLVPLFEQSGCHSRYQFHFRFLSCSCVCPSCRQSRTTARNIHLIVRRIPRFVSR